MLHNPYDDAVLLAAVDKLVLDLLTGTTHHEHVWPACDGEGAAGDPVSVSTDAADKTHAAGTDKWFWGEPSVVVAPGAIAIDWSFHGLYLYANIANKWLQWRVYFLQTSHSTNRNGGNAWLAGETILTVANGALYQALDLVWITSAAKPAGEILRVVSVLGNVVTMERELTDCACTGLRWDHTDDNTPQMYLAYRDAAGFHAFGGELSAASAKDFFRLGSFPNVSLPANTGIIARMLNQSDDTTSTAELKAIYEDM